MIVKLRRKLKQLISIVYILGHLHLLCNRCIEFIFLQAFFWIIYIYIYIYIYISSCRAASTDTPDHLSPLLPFVQRLWQVFKATFRIKKKFIAAVCMFELVVLLLLGHMWESIGVLMSSPLLFQQCPAYLVPLTWIVFVMGGRWPYSWCLVGCCRQDLFNIAWNILV